MNMNTRVDVLIKVGYDLSSNPDKYSSDQLSRLSELLPILSDDSLSGALAIKYYNLAINPVTDSITDYWSDNYISKPIYRSLVKFYNNDIENIDILIMINSVINRSLIATKENNDLSDKLRVDKLLKFMNQLIIYDIDEEYPEELLAEIKLVFSELGLFTRVADKQQGGETLSNGKDRKKV